MSDEERYEKALSFATQKHKGQYRVGGAEYITHPMAVAEIVREKAKISIVKLRRCSTICLRIPMPRRAKFLNLEMRKY